MNINNKFNMIVQKYMKKLMKDRLQIIRHLNSQLEMLYYN